MFVGACRDYGAAIRRLCAIEGEPPSFEELTRLLSYVYAATWRLPSVRLDDAHDYDVASYRRAIGVPAMYERLQEVLGAADRYSKIARGVHDDDRGVVIGSLADDLADIYGELVAGLDALDAGASLENVVWDWRSSFESHWGAHLLDASRQLHRIITGV
jgi:hypothetical protein